MEKNNFIQPVARFYSLRDTRPEPTTWQVLFKEITDDTHTAATRHYRTLWT